MVLSIASYNAGPDRIWRWMRRHGDRPLDEFVEEILRRNSFVCETSPRWLSRLPKYLSSSDQVEGVEALGEVLRRHVPQDIVLPPLRSPLPNDAFLAVHPDDEAIHAEAMIGIESFTHVDDGR